MRKTKLVVYHLSILTCILLLASGARPTHIGAAAGEGHISELDICPSRDLTMCRLGLQFKMYIGIFADVKSSATDAEAYPHSSLTVDDARTLSLGLDGECKKPSHTVCDA